MSKDSKLELSVAKLLTLHEDTNVLISGTTSKILSSMKSRELNIFTGKSNLFPLFFAYQKMIAYAKKENYDLVCINKVQSGYDQGSILCSLYKFDSN